MPELDAINAMARKAAEEIYDTTIDPNQSQEDMEAIIARHYRDLEMTPICGSVFQPSHLPPPACSLPEGHSGPCHPVPTLDSAREGLVRELVLAARAMIDVKQEHTVKHGQKCDLCEMAVFLRATLVPFEDVK